MGEMDSLPQEGALPGAADPPSHAAGVLGRLSVGLLLAVVLINVPLGLHGRSLARMVPSRTYLVIRDGLLVKEAGSPDVYVYRDGEFHWITDLEVFERYGYRWEDVREAEAGFMDSHKIGRPLYLLARCPNSPHIYLLEKGVKRWIVDIPAFEAEGYRWEDVRTIDCYTLSHMADGETIPPGHGPAPEP